jgi:hypothetical protein
MPTILTSSSNPATTPTSFPRRAPSSCSSRTPSARASACGERGRPRRLADTNMDLAGQLAAGYNFRILASG